MLEIKSQSSFVKCFCDTQTLRMAERKKLLELFIFSGMSDQFIWLRSHRTVFTVSVKIMSC